MTENTMKRMNPGIIDAAGIAEVAEPLMNAKINPKIEPPIYKSLPQFLPPRIATPLTMLIRTPPYSIRY